MVLPLFGVDSTVFLEYPDLNVCVGRLKGRVNNIKKGVNPCNGLYVRAQSQS